MTNITPNTQLYLAQDASDSRKCQHLYLRGNFKQDMFFDIVDKINVWNRIWLSAKAAGIQIISVIILNNHLHLNGIFPTDAHRTNFKHHFRLSITQYHNRRYQVHGTLGTRTLKHGIVKDLDDLKDCICYHIRNILHHGISSNYLDYPFSTARFVFDLATDAQKGTYTSHNIPDNLARAYLPLREQLPEGWQMTAQGLIVPPPEIFPRGFIEAIFTNRETYLETLTKPTARECDNQDEVSTYASHSRKMPTPDEQIVEFIKENTRIPIPSMNPNQKMEAICQILKEYPKANLRLLTRIFGIPYSTLRYRIKIWHLRE